MSVAFGRNALHTPEAEAIMKKLKRSGIVDLHPVMDIQTGESRRSIKEIIELLGVETCSPDRFIGSLPFSLNDTTAGSESELQTVVRGDRRNVDLPLSISRSNFFANIIRRAAAGETTRKALMGLESYLDDNAQQIWENSWVRFPIKVLSVFAREVLEDDLLADKKDQEGGLRGDVDHFIFYEAGEKWIRIPVSYLIKLSLADVIGAPENIPQVIEQTGRALLDHFSNDNTSPETFSFYVVPLRSSSHMGKAIARETAKRFLLTQLLAMYANARFKLQASGQQAIIYSAPHPPVRQRELNECVSDSFYRELFMSPCLSGWDKGEEKHNYMCLCHQVLSRSQLNAVGKLREAGIITRNLVVLPNMSNISLANNGTHVSLGSIRLSKYLGDKSLGLKAADEKVVGDLLIKTVEHFLPLFVGTYSAAPYRLDFADFHPEKVLGFLPHELDYTHLRMIWRRWKKKADLNICGRPVTPFGPDWLDRVIKTLLRLKGDFIPDFRLIDYFVALMSTDRSPALDGKLGNAERLKRDLADLGVFDRKMATYMLCRHREYDAMGFSGFEGRFYSLFESMTNDMARAADLQTLLNALAFKYIARGEVSHSLIPDIPSIESERRQIFFGTAIGIPTFFVRRDTPNVFLQRIVGRCARVRQSRRYPGYLRVYNLEYRKALVQMIREDAADLIEALDLGETMEDLAGRLNHPEEHSAFGKLTRSILNEVNARSPMDINGREFNLAAERYYRDTLRKKHMEEAITFLEEDIRMLDSGCAGEEGAYREELRFVLQDRSAMELLHTIKEDLVEETASLKELEAIINLLLITIDHDIRQAKAILDGVTTGEERQTSIHRAAHW
jgi:hypothetical protein